MPSRRKRSILLDCAFEDEIINAIEEHAAWRVRLSSAIRSGSVDASLSDVRNDNICALGKWLHGSTIPAHLDPNYIMVRQIHANFHECAARAVGLVLAGNKVQADAMMGLEGEYTKISSQLIAAMMKWKQAIGTW